MAAAATSFSLTIRLQIPRRTLKRRSSPLVRKRRNTYLLCAGIGSRSSSDRHKQSLPRPCESNTTGARQDIWLYGGANLITNFVNAGLVDEYRLSVHPIILGAGKPLFADIVKQSRIETYRNEDIPFRCRDLVLRQGITWIPLGVPVIFPVQNSP